jgi:hypothetical protein
MADYLAAKASTEVVERRWTVPVDADDAPASVAIVASGVTLDASEIEQGDIVFTISGGTAAATGSLVVTVTTDQARVLVATLYIPVVESAAQIANTARSYCTFALRKIVGLGETPDATELEDALEQLNGLVAMWREGGADIGAAFPIGADTVIYCPDWAVDAIRYNLRLGVYSLYDAQPSQMDVIKAKQGLQLIKHNNLPVERKAVYL